MKDPLLIDDWKVEIPASQRQQYETEKLSPADLRKSANTAHDRIRRLTEANNQLVFLLVDMQKKLKASNRWLWFMGLIVSPTVGAIVKFAVDKYLLGSGH